MGNGNFLSPVNLDALGVGVYVTFQLGPAILPGGISIGPDASTPFIDGVLHLAALMTITDLTSREVLIFAPLIVGTLWLGLAPDGVFHVTRAVVPGMVQRRRGAVVNLASWLGRRGHPAFSAYAATKFAVVGMTQSLAPEVAPSGVRVNAVCPGLIGGTPMREALDATSEAAGLPRAAERAKSIPLGRVGTPEDVAKVVAFLASDEAAYVTGACYDVAGGLWMT